MGSAAIDLSHTPGINYALAYWLSCAVYSMLLPRRNLRKRDHFAVSLTALLGLTSFMNLTDGPVRNMSQGAHINQPD